MKPMNCNMNGSWCPTNPQLHHSLKIHKDSHTIKKSSSSSSSSSSPPPKPQQRHPVIIYTHSPRVINTNPNDFKLLVQRLTGMDQPDLEDDKDKMKKSPDSYHQDPKGEESSSLSGITTSEDISSNGGDNSNCLGSLLPPLPPMALNQTHNSFIGIPLYPSELHTNNSSTNNKNNNSDFNCCNSGSSTTTDPTYDFVDFNVAFN